MKVLFAVNNESISETIIKKYQKSYDELLEYKNVYYYNAIIKEIQKEKDYDMIVISEDLETISSNDRNRVDAFVLDKLEKIIDVFKLESIEPIPILFISNEKRGIKDEILPTMFNLGIYNALVGKDRTITKICEIIKNPRSESEARVYYNLGAKESISKEKEIVNPREINNILRHYKKIITMPDRFSSSFDRIASQYDDIQLKYIIDKLPKEVTQVLDSESKKYKEVLNIEREELEEELQEEILETSKSNIVIPGEVSRTKIKAQTKSKPKAKKEVKTPVVEKAKEEIKEVEPIEEIKVEEIVLPEEDIVLPVDEIEEDIDLGDIVIEASDEDDLDIFGDLDKTLEIDEEDDDFIPIFDEDDIDIDEDILLNLDEEETVDEVDTLGLEISEIDDEINIFADDLLEDETEDLVIPGIEDIEESEEIEEVEVKLVEEVPTKEAKKEPEIIIEEPVENVKEKEIVSQRKKDFILPDLSSVLSKDKKVVVFVGTSKNGTSFIVNSLGMMFASIGIRTAILDMTSNKNSYYLSTKNDERLRQVAIDSTTKLKEGIADGVDVIRGLTVYTALPGDKEDFSDSQTILSTLVKNYSLVLIDSDFDTDFGYFSAAQEIYLVQSLDVLTIQPLTAFLKELLDAGVLTTEKVKVVLNKEVPVRGLTRKLLVGGLSTYNDPAMSIMTNLFDRNQVQVASIPFDQNVYSKYLENIVECKYDISGYPKKFVEALKVLANMVYPLISKQRDISMDAGPRIKSDPLPKDAFSDDMSSTLDQMRKNL